MSFFVFGNWGKVKKQKNTMTEFRAMFRHFHILERFKKVELLKMTFNDIIINYA